MNTNNQVRLINIIDILRQKKPEIDAFIHAYVPAFSDGNKRIAAALFIVFLAGNKELYRKDGLKRLADNALVAITLIVGESNPADKGTMVKLIANLINARN